MKKIIILFPVILLSLISYINSEIIVPQLNDSTLSDKIDSGKSQIKIVISNDFNLTIEGKIYNNTDSTLTILFPSKISTEQINSKIKNKIEDKRIPPKFNLQKGDKIEYSYIIPKDSSHYSFSSQFLHLENFLPFIKNNIDENIEIIIHKDKNLKVCTSLFPTNENESEQEFFLNFNQLKEFKLLASEYLIEKKFQHRGSSIRLYVLDDRDWYIERYIKTINTTLDYFNEYLGENPFSELNIIDLPHSVFDKDKLLPGIVTFSGKLLSPEEYLKPENDIIYGLSRQIFGAKIKFSDGDKWLETGLSEYLKNEIISEKFGYPKKSFNLAGYFPVPGINFIEYDEIPLIYTLGMYPYSPYVVNMENYYKNSRIASLTDSCFEALSYEQRKAILKDKSALVLKTIEMYIGKEKFNQIFLNLYHKKKNDSFEITEFYKEIKNIDPQFFNYVKSELVKSRKYIDYSISSVKQNGNNISIICNRLGEGKLPCDIEVVTESDTILLKWNGEETWKEFNLTSNTKVVSAEIDPKGKNFLDINISNNSYTVNSNYLITFSLSLKWMFWVQNMLIILGLIG